MKSFRKKKMLSEDELRFLQHFENLKSYAGIEQNDTNTPCDNCTWWYQQRELQPGCPGEEQGRTPSGFLGGEGERWGAMLPAHTRHRES